MRIFIIGSVTKAERAKELLKRNGVPARIGKQSERDGCVHYVEVSDGSGQAAAAILRNAGIAGAGEYSGRRGSDGK